jgi:hypothetical protein
MRLQNQQGTEFGRITLNDGTSRNFWNRDLPPYLHQDAQAALC